MSSSDRLEPEAPAAGGLVVKKKLPNADGEGDKPVFAKPERKSAFGAHPFPHV